MIPAACSQKAMILTQEVFILVVEDEVFIQTLVEDALIEGGYRVNVISSGDEALKCLDVQEPEFRALVTDVNLGSNKIDGWELARKAREINPELPIVYMTGDSAADWASRGVPNSVLLSKPFAPAQLVTAVSQLLNVSAPPTS